MKRVLLILLCALGMTVQMSAQKQVVVEHGYSGFSAVEAGDCFDISLTASDEYKVRITTDAVVEDYILAYAKDGVLYLDIDVKAMPSETRRAFQSRNRVLATPRVEIFSPSLERIAVSGNSVIDCNDTTSNKGMFTFGLRKRLDAKGISYSITNLKSSEAYFAKAFSTSKRNVVILNTGRSPQLNVALAKLDGLTATNPGMRISMFGYTEWLMYTKVYLNYFYKYNAYIPTTFYYIALSDQTEAFENSYRKWFRTDMQTALPRFALTGYDHARFFIEGEYARGKSFRGTKGQSAYRPLQTPLKFVYASPDGGMRNSAFMLVHYMSSRRIESISY